MLAVPRSQHARQSRHWLPCSAAGQLLLPVTTVDVQGQKPAAGLFILCPDNLIIKFFGSTAGSIKDRKRASRVGSQCCTCCVALHTSKIFFKCCTLCRSPASCHLKNGTLRLYQVTSTVMASIHFGSVKEFNLRASASFTFGNLYRPFRA